MARFFMIAAALLAVGLIGAGKAPARAEDGQEHAEWGYGAGDGPSRWADISPEFATCASGEEQSPIDIAGEHPVSSSVLEIDYASGQASIVNLGHTVQVKVAPGNKLTFGDAEYELLQFHFHTPSENTFHGMHFPLETHFVHRDDEGNLAVVALMVRPGEAGALDLLPVPAKAGDEEALGKDFSPASMLPPELAYLTFAGSLTTPPCSEGVRWIVLKETVTASIQTLSRLSEVLGRNNRPVNPLNGREVRESH